MESLWKKIRSPFYSVDCKKHQWENFDVNKAGCLKCGKIHICCENVFMNTCCPLIRCDDGSRICEITGLSVECLRTSDIEHIKTCVFVDLNYQPSFQAQREHVSDYILSTVTTFFFNPKLVFCKKKENEKKIIRLLGCVNKSLKNIKNSQNFKQPSIHELVAMALHHSTPLCSLMPTEKIVIECVQHIIKCVFDLKLVNTIQNKPNLVIGILYLLKSGLWVNNKYLLPKVQKIAYYLPQENSLERMYGYSIKLICETENELKLIIRQQKKSL